MDKCKELFQNTLIRTQYILIAFSVHFPETLVISSTGQASEAVPTCLGRSLLVTFVTCFTVFKFNPKTSVPCRFSKMSDLFVNGRPVWEQVDGDKPARLTICDGDTV